MFPLMNFLICNPFPVNLSNFIDWEKKHLVQICLAQPSTEDVGKIHHSCNVEMYNEIKHLHAHKKKNVN